MACEVGHYVFESVGLLLGGYTLFTLDKHLLQSRFQVGVGLGQFGDGAVLFLSESRRVLELS